MNAPGERASSPTAEWTPARRLALRFVILFLAVDFLPLLLLIPGEVDIPTPAGDWLHSAILSLGAWLLRIGDTAQGSTAEFKAQMAGSAVIAAALTLVWSALDRRERDYSRLHDRLRIALRYALGMSMCVYGAIKIIPSQFAPPTLDVLLRPVGQLHPMQLLWNFMGFSTAYVVFSGIAELAGGIMVFFRRTTTLGVLTLFAVLCNVVMMNFAYDVNVKVVSFTLWLFAAILLAPDVPRVLKALLAERGNDAVPPPLATGSTLRRRLRLALKSIAVTAFIVLPFVLSYVSRATGAPSTRSAFHGAYDVDVFVRAGDTIRLGVSDTTRWRRVIREDYGFLSIQRTGDDAMFRIRVRDDSANKRLVLRNMPDSLSLWALSYRSVDSSHVALDGVVDHEQVHALMHRIDARSLPLLRPFR